MFVVDAEVMDDVGEALPEAGLEIDEALMAFEPEAVLVDAAREEEGRDEEVLATLLLELIEELRLVLDDEVVAASEVVLEVLRLAAAFLVEARQGVFGSLEGFGLWFKVTLKAALEDLESPAVGFGLELLLPAIASRASRGSEDSSSTIVS